ncbi:hypothetical protein [Paenibacillus sp. L3-i20]|uniref:hypothetical protein n=1 Tax=Paenibacillus sp. L3-i20 TaxID=2905833 RepID=UPI0020C08DB7|nr:hypothetical protein [Paenibacillus sp. L3-i20]
MNEFDELLSKLEDVRALFKRNDPGGITQQITYLLELLDDYQNAHLSVAAKKMVSYILILEG